MEAMKNDEWPTRRAISEMEGEILRAGARIRQRRAQRRETVVFLFGALALAPLLWVAAPALSKYGVSAIGLMLCAMALTLIFAPVLAWFAEEGRYKNEIE